MSTITEIQEAIEKLPASEKSVLAAWLQSKEEPIMSGREEAALLARLDKAAAELDAGKGVRSHASARKFVDGLESNSHLQSKGWRVERERLLVKDFPVQFLAASGLTEEAVRTAKPIEYEGVPAKVFRPEYIIAIAAGVGRHKDLARIGQLMSHAKIDRPLLDDILRRYNLKLPKK